MISDDGVFTNVDHDEDNDNDGDDNDIEKLMMVMMMMVMVMMTTTTTTMVMMTTATTTTTIYLLMGGSDDDDDDGVVKIYPLMGGSYLTDPQWNPASWNFSAALIRTQTDLYVDALFSPRVRVDQTNSSRRVIAVSAVFTCCRNTQTSKLQALVYDILPSTTAVFSYAIGPRKLLANEQFFAGAQTVVTLLQTTQIISDVCFVLPC